MNKKLSSAFVDFIGENAMVGEFTIEKTKRGHYVMHYAIYCDGNKVRDMYDAYTAKEVLRQIKRWKQTAKQAAHDAYDCINPNAWETVTDEWTMNDDEYQTQYIGSIFQLTPSGKYYTPWANSNVDIVEAAMDSIFYKTLEDLLDKDNLWLTCGEGDPCDLFVNKAI